MYTMTFDVTHDRKISLRLFVKNEKHPSLIPGINELIIFFNMLSINGYYSTFMPYDNDRGWEITWLFPMHLLFFFFERYRHDIDASTGPLAYYVDRLSNSVRNMDDILLPMIKDV